MGGKVKNRKINLKKIRNKGNEINEKIILFLDYCLWSMHEPMVPFFEIERFKRCHPRLVSWLSYVGHSYPCSIDTSTIKSNF